MGRRRYCKGRGSAERDQQGLRRAAESIRQIVPGRVFLGGHSYGGRQGTLLVAGAVLLIIPLVFLLLRERPEDVGLARFGEQDSPSRDQDGTPVSTSAGAMGALREGARSRDFWLLAGSFFICGASTNGLIGTHLIPACIDHGISEVGSLPPISSVQRRQPSARARSSVR